MKEGGIMPKQKSHKGIAKKVTVRPGGSTKIGKPGANHMSGKKPTSFNRKFRKLWITRINAACRMNNISYSKFIDGLNKAGVEINRKMLSELAIQDMNEFNKLVEVAKKALENGKVETETKTESNDLSSKALAKEKGIEGCTTMKKADLLNALK